MFKVLYYTKLFELFSNAAGYLVAYAIMTSCSASIRKTSIGEKVKCIKCVYYSISNCCSCSRFTT